MVIWFKLPVQLPYYEQYCNNLVFTDQYQTKKLETLKKFADPDNNKICIFDDAWLLNLFG